MFRSYFLFAFGLVIIYLEVTGKISRYMNPEAAKFNVAAALFLFVLGLYARRNRNRPINLGGMAGYIILLVPLILLLLFPAREFGASQIPAKGIKLIGFSLKDNTRLQDVPVSRYHNLPEITPDEEEINLNEKTFMDLADKLDKSPSFFNGRRIIMEGFACYPFRRQPNLLVLARYVIKHCAADAAVIGLVVDLNGLTPPPQDTWVRVEGNIVLQEDNLLVRANSLKEVARPENSYIYP